MRKMPRRKPPKMFPSAAQGELLKQFESAWFTGPGRTQETLVTAVDAARSAAPELDASFSPTTYH